MFKSSKLSETRVAFRIYSRVLDRLRFDLGAYCKTQKTGVAPFWSPIFS